MKMSETYADGFKKTFTELEDFLGFLQSIENNSNWIRVKSNSLKLLYCKKEDLEKLKKQGLNQSILEDTMKNTELIIKSAKQLYPVRGCAIKTILERAAINGAALKKVKKPIYTKILNECLKVAKGISLLRICEGKVSAVLGGDINEYAILDMQQIFSHTAQYLKNNFSNCTYLGGFYEHHISSSVWEIYEPELFKQYQQEIQVYKKERKEMSALLRVTTSNTGISGANIYPILFIDKNVTIPLGTPIRLEHKSQANIKKFDEQLSMIYSKYQVATKGLIKLLSIPIQNPIYCIKNVCKKLGISIKYRIEAAELFRAQYGEDPCTAHEIYYGISEILYMLACEGENGSKLLQMEEMISRALNIIWKEYDIPENL